MVDDRTVIMPVDIYIGNWHAVLHLLYAGFPQDYEDEGLVTR